MITVLSVGYPLAPVGPDSVGGAEQVLSALDRWLSETGHRSIVVAAAGSRAFGTLIPVEVPQGLLDDRAIHTARRRFAETVSEALGHYAVDLVHMHGFDFDRYMPSDGPPVLATLHCPGDWYTAEALAPIRPDVWLNAVSERQHRSMLPNPRLMPPVENGVRIPETVPAEVGDFALTLSRIAPEKGIDIAMRAAHRAGIPLLVAGAVYLYPEHIRYAEQVLAPLSDATRRLIGPVAGDAKSRLLGSARCVVVSSVVEETSSLTAREALAAGAPVIAFRSGALADVVDHGVTGFLVESEIELAEALIAIASLDRSACRAAAARLFSIDRMHRGYLGHYRTIIDEAAGGRGA